MKSRGKGGLFMTQNKFDVSFQSDIYKVNDIVDNSLRFLKNNFPLLNDNNLMEFRLIFCELLFNAVIHGNKQDAGKNVFFSINVTGGYVNSIVSDEGNGFDYNKALKISCMAENIFLESGRGIRLVKSLVDRLDFDTNGSTVKFCKKVESDG